MLAVIGDIPYGADQLAAFPGWIDQINAAKPDLASMSVTSRTAPPAATTPTTG